MTLERYSGKVGSMVRMVSNRTPASNGAAGRPSRIKAEAARNTL
jgi:hypothetical protein